MSVSASEDAKHGEFTHRKGLLQPVLSAFPSENRCPRRSSELLLLPKLMESPLLRHEVIEGPLLKDTTVFKNEDVIHLPDRREAVRDDDRGDRLEELMERVADLLLGFQIEVRGRFVEKEDLRFLEDGARDAEALLLAARELDPLLADEGPEALRQTMDEVGDMRDIDRFRRPSSFSFEGFASAMFSWSVKLKTSVSWSTTAV
jgi:hypothetical protein